MMSGKKSRYVWIRAVVFLILTVLLLEGLTKIFVPKYYGNNPWPTTSAYANFYDIEKESIDVVFLGSSRAMAAFSPQELYNEYGITSYNLGSEQQSIFISYYWLKEALRFQSPKAVVIETKEIFFHKAGALNIAEPMLRKSMDYMKWSSVKKEAVDDICSLDISQDKLSYYFPIFRFHTRWKELEEDDLSYFLRPRDGELKGYNVLSKSVGKEYTPYEEGANDEKAEMHEQMVIYMDRMVQLCRENDIPLILITTPAGTHNIENHNSMAAYAKENGLPYYDFNLKETYEEIGYDFAADNGDKSHLNIWGAAKITDFIGQVLSEQYGIAAREDAQWENTAEYYEQIKKDCSLTKITDIYEYLPLLEDERYSIFVAVKGDAAGAVTDEVLTMFRRFGITIPLEGAVNASYYAVIDGDYRKEEIGQQVLSAVGALRNGIEAYQITSGGTGSGNSCEIIIDGKDCAVGKNGFNIVVYNNEIREVTDSVCFDTGTPEFTAYR